MAKYLIQGNYLAEGVKGLLKEGALKRRDAVEKLITSLGGQVESMYYAFGDTDVYVVVDLPDNISAAAASLVVNASGAVTIRSTMLMTPEEMDEAAKRAPSYRAPGS